MYTLLNAGQNSLLFQYFQTAVNVALKCRPMLMEKPSDYANNISDLGRIVFEMMKNTDKDINFK